MNTRDIIAPSGRGEGRGVIDYDLGVYWELLGEKGGPTSGWYAPPKGTHGAGSQGGAVQMVLPGTAWEMDPRKTHRPSSDEQWNQYRERLASLSGTPPTRPESEAEIAKKDRYFNIDVETEVEVKYEAETLYYHIDEDDPSQSEVAYRIFYEDPQPESHYDTRVVVDTITLTGEDAVVWDEVESIYDNTVSGLYNEGYWDKGTGEFVPILLPDYHWDAASDETRGAMKNNIASFLTEAINQNPAIAGTGKKASYDDIDTTIWSWSQSATKDVNTANLQRIAGQEFGLPVSDWIEGQVREFRRRGEQPALSEGLMRAFVQETYFETQASLRSKGYDFGDRILLYRGFTLPEDQAQQIGLTQRGSIARMVQNPLSSWSISENDAFRFATTSDPGEVGMVVAMMVPVEHIMSSAVTGLGCLTEGEFIVIGYPGEVEVVDI